MNDPTRSTTGGTADGGPRPDGALGSAHPFPRDRTGRADDPLGVGGRTFWLAQLAFWGAFGAVTYLTFLGQLEPEQRAPVALLKLVIRPTLGLAASTLLMLGYRRWLEGRRRPAWLAGAAVVGACTSLAVLWFLAGAALYRPFNPFGGALDWAQVPRSLLEYVFVLLAWSAGYFWIRSRRDARRQERQALRAAAAARSAQLELLAQQLHPHFLFNALTSLRGLIHEDPDRADAVVGRLAAFLRRTLARPATEVGSLAEELAHVEAYLEVERSRHGDELEAVIDVEPGAEDAPIPAFLLYPLVENAVKHGRAPEGEPRRIVIRAGLADGRLRVEVANPGTLAGGETSAFETDGAGVGLRNVRRRLAQYAPGRHALRLEADDGWVRAVLEVDPDALPQPEPGPDRAARSDRPPAPRPEPARRSGPEPASASDGGSGRA